MINISGMHNKLDAVKFFEKYYIAYKKQDIKDYFYRR